MDISNDNFLRTGDNYCLEYANLAGHATNFVDNEASLDFLSHSNAKLHPNGVVEQNFSALMRDLENESQLLPAIRKDSFHNNL